MAIAPTFQRYLDQHVTYDVIAHEPTMSSMRTAQACHVPGNFLAKGVLLRDDTGYMLAVLPATHYIRMHDLRLQFGEDVGFASEGEIDELFQDCAHGAVPPIGECYGLDTIVDDAIDGQGEVYLEAGDHATLVHLSHAQFTKLTADARHGRFSVHV
ncbi:MAG: YbaK/EbsC family protein [Rhodoplanes sp.]